MMAELTLGERINDFIAYKRSLGYVYDTQERYLKHYQKHMENEYPHLLLPDKESTDCFLNKFQGQTGGLYNAMAPLREFSRYLFRIGFHDAYLVPPKQMPKLHPEPPYFFSEDEISAFFRECSLYYSEHKVPAGRSFVIPAEFRLLYCCGLRPKEARILSVKDVHLSEKYIDVTQSKGPKNRRIYISDELSSYLCQYDHSISSLFPDRVYFFPKNRIRIPCSSFITTLGSYGDAHSLTGRESRHGFILSDITLHGQISTAGPEKERMSIPCCHI